MRDDTRFTTVLLLADLNGQLSAHSALENYTTGIIHGLGERGLLVQPVDAGSKWIVSNINSVSSGGTAVARPRRRAVLKDYISAISIALKHFKNRRRSVLFAVNAARSYVGIFLLFKLLGFPIAYWILDYYPSKAATTNRILSYFSCLNICINSYIATLLNSGVPAKIFHGGTTLPPPSHLNEPTSKEPLRLFYAGNLNKLNAVDQILKAVAESDGRLTLELFGGGDLEDLAHQYAADYSNIHMRGLAPRENVIAALNRAHVALCVRRMNDGYYRHFFPSKLIEMLASPALIVASDMKEVTAPLKNALIFCESHNARHILAAVDRVRALSSHEKEKYLEEKIRLVKEEFDWRRISDIILDSR